MSLRFITVLVVFTTTHSQQLNSTTTTTKTPTIVPIKQKETLTLDIDTTITQQKKPDDILTTNFINTNNKTRRLFEDDEDIDIDGEYNIDAVKEAAQFGLQEMEKLFGVQERMLYERGSWLLEDEPGHLLSEFGAPKRGAVLQARLAYATLAATKKLKQSLPNIESRAAPLRASLRRTPLEGLCPHRSRPRCPPASRRYRTHDGTCNNERQPRWGAAMMPAQRYLPPDYDDGVESIRRSISGAPLPSARLISLHVHGPRQVEGRVTLFLMQWGQFVDHDMTQTAQQRSFNNSVPRCCSSQGDLHPACLPIPVPFDDPWLGPLGIRCLEFTRSGPAVRPDCTLGWREQVNQVTSYLDASTVYSSNSRTSDNIRVFRRGQLVLGGTPSRSDPCRLAALANRCVKAGDGRSSEQPGLLAMHSVFQNEHNRLANELSDMNPHWSDEKIYQETRRIIGAIVQHITYREFLPLVLGPPIMKLFDLELLRTGYYDGYSSKTNAGVASSFSSAAFRFGHSLVQDSYLRSDENHRFLFNNVSLHEEQSGGGDQNSPHSLHRLLRGMSNQRAQRRDEFISSELTQHLFQTSRFPFGLDLAAINIQRGRDHGIPPYVTWREPCGLTELRDWEDLIPIMGINTVERLRRTYRDIRDIDLFAGGLSERPVFGGLVGPTMGCIIAQQFANTRKGDRFWYENGGFESSFTPAQLQSIRHTSLAQLICNTLEGGTLQPNIMLAPDEDNIRRPCGQTPLGFFDLGPWIERRIDFDRDTINQFGDHFGQSSIQNNQIFQNSLNFSDKIDFQTARPFSTTKNFLNLNTKRPLNKFSTAKPPVDFIDLSSGKRPISVTKNPSAVSVNNKVDLLPTNNPLFNDKFLESSDGKPVDDKLDLSDKIQFETHTLQVLPTIRPINIKNKIDTDVNSQNSFINLNKRTTKRPNTVTAMVQPINVDNKLDLTTTRPVRRRRPTATSSNNKKPTRKPTNTNKTDNTQTSTIQVDDKLGFSQNHRPKNKKRKQNPRTNQKNLSDSRNTVLVTSETKITIPFSNSDNATGYFNNLAIDSTIRFKDTTEHDQEDYYNSLPNIYYLDDLNKEPETTILDKNRPYVGLIRPTDKIELDEGYDSVDDDILPTYSTKIGSSYDNYRPSRPNYENRPIIDQTIHLVSTYDKKGQNRPQIVTYGHDRPYDSTHRPFYDNISTKRPNYGQTKPTYDNVYDKRPTYDYRPDSYTSRPDYDVSQSTKPNYNNFYASRPAYDSVGQNNDRPLPHKPQILTTFNSYNSNDNYDQTTRPSFEHKVGSDYYTDVKFTTSRPSFIDRVELTQNNRPISETHYSSTPVYDLSNDEIYHRPTVNKNPVNIYNNKETRPNFEVIDYNSDSVVVESNKPAFLTNFETPMKIDDKLDFSGIVHQTNRPNFSKQKTDITAFYYKQPSPLKTDIDKDRPFVLDTYDTDSNTNELTTPVPKLTTFFEVMTTKSTTESVLSDESVHKVVGILLNSYNDYYNISVKKPQYNYDSIRPNLPNFDRYGQINGDTVYDKPNLGQTYIDNLGETTKDKVYESNYNPYRPSITKRPTPTLRPFYDNNAQNIPNYGQNILAQLGQHKIKTKDEVTTRKSILNNNVHVTVINRVTTSHGTVNNNNKYTGVEALSSSSSGYLNLLTTDKTNLNHDTIFIEIASSRPNKQTDITTNSQLNTFGHNDKDYFTGETSSSENNDAFYRNTGHSDILAADDTNTTSDKYLNTAVNTSYAETITDSAIKTTNTSDFIKDSNQTILQQNLTNTEKLTKNDSITSLRQNNDTARQVLNGTKRNNEDIPILNANNQTKPNLQDNATFLGEIKTDKVKEINFDVATSVKFTVDNKTDQKSTQDLNLVVRNITGRSEDDKNHELNFTDDKNKTTNADISDSGISDDDDDDFDEDIDDLDGAFSTNRKVILKSADLKQKVNFELLPSESEPDLWLMYEESPLKLPLPDIPVLAAAEDSNPVEELPKPIKIKIKNNI